MSAGDLAYSKCAHCGHTVYRHLNADGTTDIADFGPHTTQDCWHLYYNGASDDGHMPTWTEPRPGVTIAPIVVGWPAVFGTAWFESFESDRPIPATAVWCPSCRADAATPCVYRSDGERLDGVHAARTRAADALYALQQALANDKENRS